MSQPTLFQRIMAGEIPANKLHEDDHCIAIRDIAPQAPTHILVIPRKPLPRIAEANESDLALLGHLLLIARKVAHDEGLQRGFRIVINNGPDGGESVPHLHVHLLGGRPLSWPPG
ncbi:MAG: histidine triad nucleotide-binding protein [Opitutales bacterium]|nr:histidine triad nucleotide-binding protein [Opitutales bacterium]